MNSWSCCDSGYKVKPLTTCLQFFHQWRVFMCIFPLCPIVIYYKAVLPKSMFQALFWTPELPSSSWSGLCTVCWLSTYCNVHSVYYVVSLGADLHSYLCRGPGHTEDPHDQAMVHHWLDRDRRGGSYRSGWATRASEKGPTLHLHYLYQLKW